MTKLNYSNRKSEGPKLGQIVAKDLRRRTKRPSSATAAHTPIDLNLEGKNLTDDGVAEFASTLTEVLTPVHGVAPARLSILVLRSNGLTTTSLALLAPSIRAAAAQLEELDLSNNNISVNDRSAREEWVTFWESFSQSTALRRINLSNNDLSSFIAFEALIQEYALQFAHNVAIWEHSNDTSYGQTEVLTKSLSVLSIRDNNVSHHDGSDTLKTGHLITIPRKTQGLPAVSVLDFEDVGMTDAGAMFLSMCVERHKWAQVDLHRKLWLHKKEEPGRAMIETSGNPGLTDVGTKMLSGAESVAFDPFDDESQDSHGNEDVPGPEQGHQRRQSVPVEASRRTSGTNFTSRKTSLSGATTDSPNWTKFPSAIELNNWRKRVQRSIIESPGVNHVQLWHTSLKLLHLVRQLLINDRRVARTTSLPSSLSRHAASESSISSLHQQQQEPPPQPTYASKVMVDRTRGPTGAAILSILGESREPISPAVLRPVQKSPRATPTSAKQQTGNDFIPDSSSATVVPALEGAIDMSESDRRMVGRFPLPVWITILRSVADPQGVLTERHVDSIASYGCNRQTLQDERGRLGDSDSVQVWKALDRMGCLMY